MKLSEITFKVLAGTAERSEAIQKAVFTRGGALKDGTTKLMTTVPLCWIWDGKHLAWGEIDSYMASPEVEMTFAQALAAINNCEAPKKDSGAWIELDVEEDGIFKLPEGKYGYWWGWAAALERHGQCDLLFGGWLFVDSDSECWGNEYMSRNNQGQLCSNMGGDRKPAVPVKIRFWRPAK